MSANAKKQLLTGESSRPGKEAIINEGIGRAPAQILVDGGDPEETVRVKRLVGYVDGQTTNPTLVARNPEVRTLVSSGQKFSYRVELAEYRKNCTGNFACGWRRRRFDRGVRGLRYHG